MHQDLQQLPQYVTYNCHLCWWTELWISQCFELFELEKKTCTQKILCSRAPKMGQRGDPREMPRSVNEASLL